MAKDGRPPHRNARRVAVLRKKRGKERKTAFRIRMPVRDTQLTQLTRSDLQAVDRLRADRDCLGTVPRGMKSSEGAATPTASQRSGASSPHTPTPSGGFKEPIVLKVPRGGELGITLTNHDDSRAPGVRVTALSVGGHCAKAGMLTGSALIAVAGTPVKSHAQAMQLLKAEVRRPRVLSARRPRPQPLTAVPSFRDRSRTATTCASCSRWSCASRRIPIGRSCRAYDRREHAGDRVPARRTIS